MRPDLRLRLREITKSLSTPKMGVSGVTGVVSEVPHTLSHAGVTREASEIPQQNQHATPDTPRHTLEKTGGRLRHTSASVSGVVTEGVAASGADPADWFAFFDERAGIMEFDGGLDRAEAEQRALAETIAALGPKPSVH